MSLCSLHSVFQMREDLIVQQWSYCAYLCLRCGLQVTQPIAQPLGSQAELAILLLDAGHALEYHFIILSRQNRLQSVCASVESASTENTNSPIHAHAYPSTLTNLARRPFKCFISGPSPPQWEGKNRTSQTTGRNNKTINAKSHQFID